MKQNILLGSYGWRHQHWKGAFYPQDLPDSDDDDWRLAYYSNEFGAVMVPASYWSSDGCCADRFTEWRDAVNQQFRFLIECSTDMFDADNPGSVTIDDFSDCLQVLATQTTALVLCDSIKYSTASLATLTQLAQSHQLKLLSVGEHDSESVDHKLQEVWQPGSDVASDVALIESDLSDLRQVRGMIESFVACCDVDNAESVMIIRHPELRASDLSDLRSVLEIMGY